MPSTSPSVSAASSLTVSRGQAMLTTTSAVKELTRLLHEHGDRILDGKAMLSLTTESLAVLNNGFDAIRESREDKSFDVLQPNHSPLTVLPELQFIHDFVQKTPSLRLVHGNNTIQGCVSLQTFRSLQHLEMRRIPVHLLQGLQRVRPKLVVLSVERCLYQLQDLFEALPAEEFALASLSWGALEKVYLPYNFVEHLDGSLRLLPLVKVLDISHNCLKSTDAYLGYLTELVHLNLSYNSLPTIPSLSMSSRTRLLTLVLANNHIDNLEGLETLEGLQILDLSSNLLCDHRGLTAIRRLCTLKELYLAFNPLAYHKQHRSRTAPSVAPIVLHTLRLDGVPFSSTELAHGRAMLVARRLPSGAAAGSRTTLTGSRVNLLTNTDDFIGDGNTLDSLTVSLQGRASVRRARNIQVDDIDDVGDSSSGIGRTVATARMDEPVEAVLSSRAASFQHEIASAKQEMERRRQQLGDSWLTSLVTSTPISATARPQSVSAQLGAPVTGASSQTTNGLLPPLMLLSPPQPPDISVGLTLAQSATSPSSKQQPPLPSVAVDSYSLSPILSSPTAETGRPPSAFLHGASAVAAQVAEQASAVVTHNPSAHGIVAPYSQTAGQVVKMAIAGTAASARANDSSKDAHAHAAAGRVHSSSTSADAAASSMSAPAGLAGSAATTTSLTADQPVQSQVNGKSSTLETASSAAESDVYLAGDDDEVDLVWKDVIEDEEVDGSGEDLFIVHPQHPYPAGGSKVSSTEPYFVTICGHYLTEKDHNGHVCEKLDLRMLLLAGIASSEDSNDQIVVRLQFNYVRKDRRERRYSMENAESAEQLMKLLSPMLKQRQQSAAAASGDCMQCLRCNQTFAKEAADVRVHHKARQLIMNDTAVLEAPHCPSCGSPHVVKHEVDQQAMEPTASPPPSLPRTGSVGSLLSGIFARAEIPVPFEPPVASSRITSPERPAHISSGSRGLHQKHRLVASAGGTPLYGSLCNVSESASYYSLVEDDTVQMASSSGSFCPVDVLASPTMQYASLDRWPGAADSQSSSSSEQGSRETLVSDAADEGALRGVVLEAAALSKNKSPAPASRRSRAALAAVASRPRSLSNVSSHGSQRGLDRAGAELRSDRDRDLITARVTPAERSALGARASDRRAVPGTFNLATTLESAAAAAGELVRETAAADGGGGPVEGANSDVVIVEESSQLTFRFDDFTVVDHRLKLFLAMEHFSDDDEMCECTLLSTAVQHNTAAHFVSILTLSSAAIYIFKISRHQSKRPAGASEPDLATTISLVERQPLVDLCYVDSALNHQNFRLEFERSGYCFLVRDEMRCKSFVALLTSIVRRVAFDPSCRLQAITKLHIEYLECFSKWIQEDEDAEFSSDNSRTIAAGDSGGSSDPPEPYYLMALLRGSYDSASKTTSAFGHQEADLTLEGLEPVSIFLTGSGLYVLKENCYLPLSRCSNESAKKSYFSLRFRLKISDVSQLKVYEDMPTDVEVETFSESAEAAAMHDLQPQSGLRFALATQSAAQAFIQALSSRWQALFGIELQVDSLNGHLVQR